MRNLCAQTILILSTILFLLITNTALAETDETESVDLDTVVVTGTLPPYRGTFTPFEIPQAELTLDSEILENAGATDLVQALDLSSSVARQNNFGGLWNSFAIRGFVGDENLPSNYLVNGFNAGRGFGGPRDLSGIESVEILKGPRAALYGRGEPGGTINLVTKRPTFETAGELKISAGRYDAYRTDFDWTSPLSDNVAVRLVGFYEDADSFRDTVETEKQGLSPSIAFRFNERNRLVYELEYSDQEIPFDRGVIAIDNRLGRISDSTFLGAPDFGPIHTDVLGHQLEFQHDFNDNWRALLGGNYRDTSLRGWAAENGFGVPNLTTGEFDRFSRFRDYTAEYYVLRAELQGRFNTGGLEHNILVGVDADEFENDQYALRDRTSPQEINIFNPDDPSFPGSNLQVSDLANAIPQIDRVETQESRGFYIQDQISLTEKLDIRLGARYDDYEQDLENRIGDDSDYDETRWSPQFGVVYQASDALSLYATYGENFRPLSAATDENNLDPNISRSSEVGIKFLLNDGLLEGTLALFEVNQSNIQGATTPMNFDAIAIGEAESQGVELDLVGQLTDTISIFMSYSYIDAETKNDFVDPNFGGIIPAGSDLLNIPEHQFSLQLAKETQFAGRPLTLIGNMIYVDERNGFFNSQS